MTTHEMPARVRVRALMRTKLVLAVLLLVLRRVGPPRPLLS
jgi:hypothetical protein